MINGKFLIDISIWFVLAIFPFPYKNLGKGIAFLVIGVSSY